MNYKSILFKGGFLRDKFIRPTRISLPQNLFSKKLRCKKVEIIPSQSELKFTSWKNIGRGSFSQCRDPPQRFLKNWPAAQPAGRLPPSAIFLCITP